ncbi:MAG: regulatory protein RecX [Clostridia bacterium]|nr:regulatory protein RecX [Clostridia bacterium]
MINSRRVKKVKIPSSPEEAYRSALKTAMNIVGYKDNTEKTLSKKLLERGYERETVKAVLEFMKEKGYINDGRMLIRTARSLALTKLYGKARIKNELVLKQFSSEILSSLDWDDEELSDIDFVEICLKLIKRRGGARDEKTYAYLKRYGHSSSDIKRAYAIYQAESEEYEEE